MSGLNDRRTFNHSGYGWNGLYLDLLLRRALERTVRSGTLTHDLDCIHDLAGLCGIRSTERRHPLGIGGQLIYDAWKSNQRLNTGVPRLAVGSIDKACTGEVPIVLKERTRGLYVFFVHGGSKRQCHEFVGEQGNRRDQRVKLILRWWLVSRRRRRWSGLRHAGNGGNRSEGRIRLVR